MITKGKQAKEQILKGINDTSDVVKLTLGAKGKTVLIADQFGIGFSITKDGVSVARSVSFDDDLLSFGSDFVKNAAMKTVEEAGDGTTTTSILTQSMCNDIYRELQLGRNPYEVITELKEDLEVVKNVIKEKSKKVESNEDISNIAKVSANNDNSIGDLIGDIYSKTGRDVVINIIESDNTETDFEIVDGFTLKDTGYSSSQFINNTENGTVEFSNPRVHIYNGKIKQMNSHIQSLFMSNADRNSEDFRPLVIICEDIEEAPLREIVMAQGNGLIFNVAIVQTNLIYEDRKNSFIDASIFLNADYSEDRIGSFGECEKIIIDRDNVTFINGKGDTSKHVERLKQKGGNDKRVFSLESKAAIIKVGGKLGTEISEKKDRIEDAVYAVRSALEEGYCSGASSVYLFARKSKDIKTSIMKNALLSCYKQLMENAELEPFYFLKDIDNKKFGHGYNLVKDEVSDLYKDGIIDSTKVLRVSLENAVHTACNFALVEAVISK